MGTCRFCSVRVSEQIPKLFHNSHMNYLTKVLSIALGDRNDKLQFRDFYML